MIKVLSDDELTNEILPADEDDLDGDGPPSEEELECPINLSFDQFDQTNKLSFTETKNPNLRIKALDVRSYSLNNDLRFFEINPRKQPISGYKQNNKQIKHNVLPKKL